MFKKVVQPIYTTYVLIVFCSSVLFAFPFILLLSIGNNKKARFRVFLVVKYWAKWWLWMIGMKPEILGKYPGTGKYIIVANHISYLDPILIFATVPGHFRPLGKKEFAKIPVIGFIYKQVAILVDRSSVNGRAKSMRLLWHVFRNESNVLIFPEGTFNESGQPLKNFYDGAFRLAINSGAAILPVIFPDTVDRWHYSAWWKIWPGRNRVKFMEPIPATGKSIEDLQALKQKVFDLMELNLVDFKDA